jgi:hypothetical protein
VPTAVSDSCLLASIQAKARGQRRRSRTPSMMVAELLAATLAAAASPLPPLTVRKPPLGFNT